MFVSMTRFLEASDLRAVEKTVISLGDLNVVKLLLFYCLFGAAHAISLV